MRHDGPLSVPTTQSNPAHPIFAFDALPSHCPAVPDGTTFALCSPRQPFSRLARETRPAAAATGL